MSKAMLISNRHLRQRLSISNRTALLTLTRLRESSSRCAVVGCNADRRKTRLPSAFTIGYCMAIRSHTDRSPIGTGRIGEMLDRLFEWKRARVKQREAPLLKERERYLLALLNQGVSRTRVRTIACILLHVIRLMEIAELRSVDRNEIRQAAQRWLTDPESIPTGNRDRRLSTHSKMRPQIGSDSIT